MKTDALIEILQSDIDDDIFPGYGDDSESLTPEAKILFWLNLAQREWARITEVLQDSSSFPTAVVAGEELSVLDDLIIRVLRIWFQNSRRVVDPVTQKQVECKYLGDDYGASISSWELSTGNPRYAVTDWQKGFLRWVPVPVENDTAILSVVRYPLDRITSCGSVMEIDRDEDQYAMLDFVKWKVYSQQDADVYDKELGAIFRDTFFTKAESRKREVHNLTKPGGAVRYGGL